MNKKLIENLKSDYNLEEIDISEFKKIKIFPINFKLNCYKSDVLNLSYLTGKALFGLMSMTTIIITSNVKDMPIFSFDRIEAGKKDIVMFEIYDTCQNKKEYLELEKIYLLFSNYTKYDLKPCWYDEFKLKESFSVYSKGSNKFDFIIPDLFKEIFKIAYQSDDIDFNTKKKINRTFVERFVDEGGVSTQKFVDKLGKEKTKQLYFKYLFFVE